MWWMIGAAALGGLLGLGSGISQSWKEQEELRKQKEEEKRLLESKKDLFSTQYQFAKDEALKSAQDASDDTDLNESLLSRAYNSSMSSLSNQMEQQGLENQMSLINAGASSGESLASLGASGIRSGSSATTAIAQNNAINAQNLSATKKAQQVSNEYNLASAYNGLLSNTNELQNQRDQITDIRDGYSAGGKYQTMYEKELAQMNLQSDISMDRYDRGIDNASYGFWDGLTDLFGGASTGISLYNGINSFASNWKTPTTPTATTGTKLNTNKLNYNIAFGNWGNLGNGFSGGF